VIKGTISSSWWPRRACVRGASRRSGRRGPLGARSSDAVGSSSRTTSGRSDSTERWRRAFLPPDSSNGARSARWRCPSPPGLRRSDLDLVLVSPAGAVRRPRRRERGTEELMSGSWKTRPPRVEAEPSSPRHRRDVATKGANAAARRATTPSSSLRAWIFHCRWLRAGPLARQPDVRSMPSRATWRPA